MSSGAGYQGIAGANRGAPAPRGGMGRVRWDNVVKLLAGLAVVAVVVLWPRLGREAAVRVPDGVARPVLPRVPERAARGVPRRKPRRVVRPPRPAKHKKPRERPKARTRVRGSGRSSELRPAQP